MLPEELCNHRYYVSFSISIRYEGEKLLFDRVIKVFSDESDAVVCMMRQSTFASQIIIRFCISEIWCQKMNAYLDLEISS